MRSVLFVLEGWNNAGTEAYVYHLIKNLIADGNYQPVVLLLAPSDESITGGVKEIVSEFYEPENDSWKSNELLDLIKKINPVIIHNHLYSSLFKLVRLQKKTGINIVTTYHSPLIHWNFLHRAKWICSAYLSNQLIVVAGSGEKEFSTLYKLKGKLNTISPPVEPIERLVFNSDTGNDYVVTGVGRLVNKQKDWMTLIEAFSTLANKYQNIKLRIVGGGPDEKIIRETTNRLNIERCVELTGHATQDQVKNHLNSTNLFVMPSRIEGFGIAPVEAMQMGIPVITADYPASFDYIKHGVTGFHFPVGNVKQLAQQIEYCYQNRDEVAAVALVGKKVACDKFAPEKIAAQHIEIYNRLLSSNP